jgi:hypothetical protein
VEKDTSGWCLLRKDQRLGGVESRGESRDLPERRRGNPLRPSELRTGVPPIPGGGAVSIRSLVSPAKVGSALQFIFELRPI